MNKYIKLLVQILVILAINLVARAISTSFTSGWLGGILAFVALGLVDRLWEVE